MAGRILKAVPVPRLPRHRAIADALRARIAAGEYPLGGRLPTESQLAQAFAASRPTLRQALAALSGEGLIVRRPRTGSVVIATRPPVLLAHAVRSVGELLDYPGDTERRVLAAGEVTADAVLARELHCPPGKVWFRITTLRTLRPSGLPLCWTETYVLPRYAGVTRHRHHLTLPVCEQIVELYGETIERADVELYAAALPARMARRLRAAAGSPAMVVMRTYLGRGGEVFQTSVSTHPESRYRYRFELHRPAGADRGDRRRATRGG